MKKQITFLKNAASYPLIVAILLVILTSSGTIKGQTIQLPLYSGYLISVSGMGPTICEPSSALIQYWNPDIDLLLPQLSTNEATYHAVNAGEPTTIIVDIPNVGTLSNNGFIGYGYGTIGGTNTTLISSPQATNPPPGYIRFELPVVFELGAKKAYVHFTIYEDGVSCSFMIPITVLGPTTHEVPILGTTVEPQIPYLVLHAPPGDGSSSSFQMNKTTCREFQSSYAEDGSATANLAVKLGVAGSAGIFVTTDFEFSVTLSGSLTAGGVVVKTSSDQTCMTVSQGFSTGAMTGPNGGGDVFIGYGTDLAYGIYPYLKLEPGACSTVMDTGLVYLPTGIPREFVYTKEAILADIATQQAIVDNTALTVKTRNNAQNQIDVWNQVLAMNEANVANASEVIGSASFSAGASDFNETSITITETNSIEYEQYIEGTIGLETVIEVGGSGVSGGFEYKNSKRFGETQNQTNESSKLIKYTLTDDDIGDDIFNLTVVKDPMYGTPIFRVDPGSISSCPYQGGYQLDQPLLTFADDSQTLTLNDIPSGEKGYFQIKICNDSDYDRTYHLKVRDGSNLNAAQLGGVGNISNDNGKDFFVPANSCLADAQVSVEQFNASITDYEDIELYLYSLCQKEAGGAPIESSIFLSAYFEQITSIGELEHEKMTMQVVPNPNNGQFAIRLEGTTEAGQLYLTDLTGKSVYQQPVPQGATSIDVQQRNLTPGIYLLVFQSEAQRVTQKLVIER